MLLHLLEDVLTNGFLNQKVQVFETQRLIGWGP